MLAACGQTFRSAIQKQSNAQLGTFGSAFIRFFYGLLPSLILLLLIVDLDKLLSFVPAKIFMFWLLMASLGQMLFTVILGFAMARKNFGTTIALSKTDAMQAAIFEMVFLSVYPEFQVAFAITIRLCAILVIGSVVDGLASPTWIVRLESVSLGLAAGLCLGVCSVFFRIAMEALPGFDFIERAILTTSMATVGQTLVMGSYLTLFKPAQLRSCLRDWKLGSLVGIVAAVTTFMWFMAFGLMNVSSVRMLGQIEIVFSFFVTLWLFKERVRIRELIGSAMIIISILVLLS